MACPTPKQFVDGFARWVELRFGNQKLSAIYQEYEVSCLEAGSDVKLKKSSFLRIIDGRTKLNFDNLPLMLEVLRIPCSDLFFDFCVSVTTDQVHHFTKQHWGELPIHEEGVAEGGRIHYVSQTLPDHVRTRLDRLTIKPKGSTKWEPHNGHEFLLVFKGEVHVLVSDTPDQLKAKEYKLNMTEGLAFPSGLFHRIENRSTRAEATVGVARPARAYPIIREGVSPIKPIAVSDAADCVTGQI